MAVNSIILSAAAGVASHVFYFRVGEHHMLPARYFSAFLAVCAGAIAYLTKFHGATGFDATSTVFLIAGSWLAGVYISMLLYRLFFHPLRKYPGPWQARVGSLWLSSKLLKMDGYYKMTDLHKKYGKYVRVGPGTLSITDPDIMQLAFGPHAKAEKSEWYDSTGPHHSMHTVRDKAFHDRRRRVWAPAFSDKALREYESSVKIFNDKLVAQMGNLKGQPVNVSTWFNLYSFDVMGRLAFGKEYHMVDNGKRVLALDLLAEGMALAGFKFPIWVFRMLLAIPGASGDYYAFLNYCAGELKWRVENGGKEGLKDITGWLLKAYEGEAHPENDPMLQGDVRLIITAGSDTTSASLTFLFYYLAQNPSHVEKIREELRPLTNGDWSDKDIQHAQHLNGAINEALRLHPAVPSGLYRKTLPGGMQIGDHFIPGETQFFTPQYVMGHDEDIYTDADSFVPERWYSKPEMIKHKDAFAPFSMGPMNCIGRNLARMELRTLTARLLLNYDVAFAPGEDGTRIRTKTKDHFTVSPAPLDLVFTDASS